MAGDLRLLQGCEMSHISRVSEAPERSGSSKKHPDRLFGWSAHRLATTGTEFTHRSGRVNKCQHGRDDERRMSSPYPVEPPPDRQSGVSAERLTVVSWSMQNR